MRIAAVGGDSIEIKNGSLIVNDNKVPEPYVDKERAQRSYSRNFRKTRVPDDTVFVLGDFRDNSHDSRFIGPVPLDAIKGKVVPVLSTRTRPAR